MFDFIGDLFSAGADLIGGIVGGAGDIAGGLFGGGSGSSGGGIFGLGLDIFGGGGEGSIFDSPVLGHVLGAVGQQLMAPTADDRREEAAAIERGRNQALRESYGLPANPSGNNGLYTPRPLRTAEAYL